MSYASAAARHRPNLQGQRPAVAVNPLRHLSHLQGLSLLIDLKAVRPNNTKVERADFVLKDLEVEAGEVLSIFVDHVTQLLILTLESEAAYNTTLQRLHAGVPWAAADGATVYGSSSSDAVSAVRVSNIPPGLPIPFVLSHMQQFGTILNHNMGRDRLFPRATDGILHLTMVLHEVDNLPHFIQVVDDNDRLSNSLPVHMDSPRRRCYRCGRPSHLGYRCQAATRAPDAPTSIWSTLVAPPAPVTAGAASQEGLNSQPPPTVEGGGLQLELIQQEAVVLTGPPPATNQTESSQDQAALLPPQDIPDVNMAAPAAPGSGLKRSFISTLTTSSSSERGSSSSPLGAKTDADFSVVARGRSKNKKKRGAAEAAKHQRAANRTPLASPAPPRSSLEDVILKPRMEADVNNGGTTSN